MAAESVEHAHRRLAVGHSDMDVHPADWRENRVPEQEVNPLIAFLVGDLGLLLRGGRMGSRPNNPGARLNYLAAQLAKLANRLPGRSVNIADQLDLTRM